MNKNSKIAIIGGGPMGLAIGYELTLNGFKPTILEADNRRISKVLVSRSENIIEK